MSPWTPGDGKHLADTIDLLVRAQNSDSVDETIACIIQACEKLTRLVGALLSRHL